MTKMCSNCGTQNPLDAKTCKGCGKAMKRPVVTNSKFGKDSK